MFVIVTPSSKLQFPIQSNFPTRSGQLATSGLMQNDRLMMAFYPEKTAYPRLTRRSSWARRYVAWSHIKTQNMRQKWLQKMTKIDEKQRKTYAKQRKNKGKPWFSLILVIFWSHFWRIFWVLIATDANNIAPQCERRVRCGYADFLGANANTRRSF